MSGQACAMYGARASRVLAALFGAILFAALYGAPCPAAAAAGPVPAAPSASAVAASGSAEDIRDIRGPKFVLPMWLLPAVVAGGVLLVLGSYGVWLRRRRRRPRALLPFELALQRLADARALMQPASAREFSIAISDIVRTYIEQRFDVTATHQTTEEFLRDLLESPNAQLARHRSLLSGFLHECDLVKFAGMSLTLQSMESLEQSARRFVNETAEPTQALEIGEGPNSSADNPAHDSLPSA
jgi:hypothetical protein